MDYEPLLYTVKPRIEQVDTQGYDNVMYHHVDLHHLFVTYNCGHLELPRTSKWFNLNGDQLYWPYVPHILCYSSEH